MNNLETLLVLVILTGVTILRGDLRQQVDSDSIISRIDDREDHSRRIVNIVVGALTFLQHANLRMQSAINAISMVISPVCIVRIIRNRDSRLSLKVLGMGTKGEIMQKWNLRLMFALVRLTRLGKRRIC